MHTHYSQAIRKHLARGRNQCNARRAPERFIDQDALGIVKAMKTTALQDRRRIQTPYRRAATPEKNAPHRARAEWLRLHLIRHSLQSARARQTIQSDRAP